MSLADLNLWLARRRAAAEHVCQCGHKRESHHERVAGCVRGDCKCASFRRAEEA